MDAPFRVVVGVSGASGMPYALDLLEALKDLAEELLKTHAKREVTPGFAFSRDGPWGREFEGSFEYVLLEPAASA